MTQIVLIASLALATAGAGIYAAPQAKAFLDASFDPCDGASADADVHAKASKHGRAHGHAKAAAAQQRACASADDHDEDDADSARDDCPEGHTHKAHRAHRHLDAPDVAAEVHVDARIEA